MRSNKSLARKIVIVLGIVAVLAARSIFPERGLDQVGPQAILDGIFSILLLAATLYSASGIGGRILKILTGTHKIPPGSGIFAMALGLGAAAYGVLVLGLVGILGKLTIGLWLISLAAFSSDKPVILLDTIRAFLVRLASWIKGQTRAFKPLPFLCGMILLIALLYAFAPPSDYDGLMYHLRGPQLFLQAGRIHLIDEIWQANGPSTLEMLFAIGLAFGSDTFAQLIHFSYFILLLMAVIGFGREHLPERTGWLSAIILLGTPGTVFLASRAHTDFGWVLYEFLGIWALVNWTQKKDSFWLSIAGIMMGVALGVKYLALGGTLLMAGWILLERKRDIRSAFKDLLRFGLPAALIASPWYIKNWILSGNPVFPFFLSTAGWDSARISLLMTYLQSFGTGRSFTDYLLLPLNLFTENIHFTTFISIDAPSFLFPLAFIQFFRRDHPLLNRLGLYSLIWAAVWAAGSQQVRFLMPVYPIWAMLTAHVLLTLPHPSLRRVAVVGLCGGLLVLTILYQASAFLKNPPLGVVLGRESKNTYLLIAVEDYQSVQYVRDRLPAGSRTMLFWDGQSYYCGNTCIPDSEEDRWLRLTAENADVQKIASVLEQLTVDHLLIIYPGWYITYHDPFGLHLRAYEFLTNEFLPACGRLLHSDPYGQVYELTCKADNLNLDRLSSRRNIGNSFAILADKCPMEGAARIIVIPP